ncbi:MAG: response regulator, partial [Moorella sp. (in: Bacteria)]|nr:response regulator [Moorella sp. (in: firmicutes)]
MNRPVKVLVVDDSAFYRRLLVDILKADPEIQVAGFARNGREALEKVAALKPAVVTLDLEMPLMDGLETIRALMAGNPVAV